MCGWCVFDSLSSNSEEKSDQGFHGTFYTKFDPSLGVRLFLNICASYLKLRKSEDNNEGEADEYEFEYEEPFGDYSSSMQVTDEFLRFDYTTPNIILQQNSYDCGFASVANAMAFVLHMRSVRFIISNLELYDPSEHEPTMSPVNIVTNRRRSIMEEGGMQVKTSPPYVMKDGIHSLKPFWDKLMVDASAKYGKCSHSSDVLMYMRREFIDLVDCIALDGMTDTTLYSASKKKSFRS